jgi:formylmethanofuran dehydrogenase subunit E
MQGFRSLEGTQLVLELEATVKCSRCDTETPESELIEVHAWWVCGNCYDDI